MSRYLLYVACLALTLLSAWMSLRSPYWYWPLGIFGALSLLGTFLVRSGVLTSVHAFAVDPQRGVFVLAILAFFTGGGLAMFAWRARDLQQGGVFSPISREGALVLNNVLLTTACVTVLVGTLYPLALEAITGASPLDGFNPGRGNKSR